MVFTWDVAKAIVNFEKHGVSFEEAATVFGDGNGLDWDDPHIHLKSTGSNDSVDR